PHPAQARRHVLRAQEVLVTERGILSNRDSFRIHHRNRQNPHGKSSHLHRPPERPLQMRNQVAVHAVGARQQRHPCLRRNQQQHHHCRGSSVFTDSTHADGSFSETTKKCTAAT